MREYYSINELEEHTNIPGTTIRRYIQKFPNFFTSLGGARSKRYEDTAVKVLVRIKSLYDDGLESDGVDKALRNEFPFTTDVVTDGDSVVNTPPSLATSEDVAQIKESLRKNEELFKSLLKILDKQEKKLDKQEELIESQTLLITELLEKKDQADQVLIETSENEAAATEEAKEKKKGFWAWLLNR